MKTYNGRRRQAGPRRSPRRWGRRTDLESEGLRRLLVNACLLGGRPGGEDPREVGRGNRRRVQADAVRVRRLQEGRQAERPRVEEVMSSDAPSPLRRGGWGWGGAMKTEFVAVPGQDELSAVPRHLVFHPAVDAAPKVLTAGQIEHFNRDGYLKPFRIFAAAEAAELRSYFDGLLARVRRRGEGQLFDQLGPPAARPGVGRANATARSSRSCRDLLGRRCGGVGVALLLQDAGRRQDRELAPGRELLAAHARRRR